MAPSCVFEQRKIDGGSIIVASSAARFSHSSVAAAADDRAIMTFKKLSKGEQRRRGATCDDGGTKGPHSKGKEGDDDHGTQRRGNYCGWR